MVIHNIIVLLAGFFLLVKGADIFVKYAAEIARKFGVSEFVIGLTLVSLGTSIPELASSLAATIKGTSGIVIGNVVGSNIANIGLIIGVASVISLVKVNEEMLRRDGYIMLGITVLAYILISDQCLGMLESFTLLLVYLAYITFLFEDKPKYSGKYHFRAFLRYFFRLGFLAAIYKIVNGKDTKSKNDIKKDGLAKDITYLTLSGIAIVGGANYLIEAALFFAQYFSIPESIIGVTIIAIGTSLPELGITISAARKGYADIAVGNVLGSNIANIGLILGCCGMISPLEITTFTIDFSGPFMILMSIMLLAFIRSRWELHRKEGITFLIAYVGFMAFITLSKGSIS